MNLTSVDFNRTHSGRTFKLLFEDGLEEATVIVTDGEALCEELGPDPPVDYDVLESRAEEFVEKAGDYFG